MIQKILLTALSALLCPMIAGAQQFFNLTASQVRIDTELPVFTHTQPLGKSYADSTYTVSVEYPEYLDMSAADVEKYEKLWNAETSATPDITTRIVVERRSGFLETSFVPVVKIDGKYKKLVSFMLRTETKPKARRVRRANAAQRVAESGRWADHSVLATGSWAKIRVPSTGVYQLTDALVRQAGFTDLSKVRVYGYGGALHDEELSADAIAGYDDLQEVPTCTIGGKRLFHATGSVTWSSQTTRIRTRNPYSDYGYYFITQGDTEPLAVDSATFVSSFYPSNDDYHTLYEVDDYAWYQGGRNLFESTPINAGASLSRTLTIPTDADGRNKGTLTVALTAGVTSSAQVTVNDSVVGTVSLSGFGDYDFGKESIGNFTVSDLKAENTVTISCQSGGPMRLDYIAITHDTPRAAPQIATATFSVPEYVYNITNQDHHADESRDMIIIVPTSGKLTAQAQRLAEYHAQHDSLTWRIVPADELYNEFASGTPEADAYRLYMKMLYDRAETQDEMPKYIVLFGDCVWDNRMNTSVTRQLSPDDYLLCFESDNSFSGVNSFVDDGYFCALDDGEGRGASSSSSKVDKQDVAVGRFPVTNAADAKIMVDKSISYMENKNAGSWQNIVVCLGDDGNNNVHMSAADGAASIIEELNPGMQVNRILWDMYERVTSATGNTYPDITAAIKKQQQAGALIFNYTGHGSATLISHEQVLNAADFADFKNTNLPLWITASCDIMPFDGTETNIGENAVLNADGGAVAFYGTTRTVYTSQNKAIDDAYVTALFTKDAGGKYVSIGEAQRLAKNSLVTTGSAQTDRSINKLQYVLLGDPALVLNIPQTRIVIDSINGTPVDGSHDTPWIKAASVASVQGHVETTAGDTDTTFNGVITTLVKDTKEELVGKMNDQSSSGTNTAYVYYDHLKTIYNGSDSIRQGRFDLKFAVTKDINYADDSGLMTFFALSADKTKSVNGRTEDFIVGGTDDLTTDSIGPSIYCYLNSPSFVNGGDVNPTPYFVAQLSDKDGLNTSGSGIGHDLTLVIDNDPSLTYTLNDNFSYDFGSYTSGSTYYYIPELQAGQHTLRFRAWDILNNSSTTTLSFNVVNGLKPSILGVYTSKNPATTSTTFIVNHNRGGSDYDITLEVFDMSGRLLWRHNDSGTASTSTYTYDWDLTTSTGATLQTGIYLYRVRMSSDGSSKVSKAKKLVVINK